jgi:hypothetical protein
MPTQYHDGRIFRLRADPVYGSEITLKITEEELQALRQIDQEQIGGKQRRGLGLLIDFLITGSTNPALDRLMPNVQARTHDVETSRAAIPNSKRWTQNLHDAYQIIAKGEGLTDEEAQDIYARAHQIDRRDIGNRWRPARVALVAIGAVKNTGRKRRVRSQREAIVWAAVDDTWAPPQINETIQKEQILEMLNRIEEE